VEQLTKEARGSEPATQTAGKPQNPPEAGKRKNLRKQSLRTTEVGGRRRSREQGPKAEGWKAGKQNLVLGLPKAGKVLVAGNNGERQESEEAGYAQKVRG